MGKITINQESLKTGATYKRHKINNGSNVFRVLPPYGDLEAHKNYPYRKWSIAWMLDPKTQNQRPFATPDTDNQPCPVREYSDKLKTVVEDRKAQLKAEGFSDEEIKDEMKALNEIAWKMRVQKNYIYNACDKSGNTGLLELKTTAHKEIKKMMGKYIQEYGQDPTSLNSDHEEDAGVWFNIKKEGEGKNTEYSVEYNQTVEVMNGKRVRIDDRSPLPNSIVDNYHTEFGYDLNTIYSRKSYDELLEILKWNLSLVADVAPEAIIEGYEFDDAPKAKPRVATPVKPVAKPAATVKKPINLAIDDSDDIDEDDIPFAVDTKPRVAAPVAKPAPKRSSIEDIKNFADSILDD
jgi:hypothetical protein